jgi:hypothetical protein
MGTHSVRTPLARLDIHPELLLVQYLFNVQLSITNNPVFQNLRDERLFFFWLEGLILGTCTLNLLFPWTLFYFHQIQDFILNPLQIMTKCFPRCGIYLQMYRCKVSMQHEVYSYHDITFYILLRLSSFLLFSSNHVPTKYVAIHPTIPAV